MVTHAPRWEIQESSLGIPHEEVAIETSDGRELSAWYVPSRNRTAVLLSHGSGGSRERVAPHVRMLARHGYGVLALDNPGNGESQGHSNGLGDNAQPGVDAALRWLSRRPELVCMSLSTFQDRTRRAIASEASLSLMSASLPPCTCGVHDAVRHVLVEETERDRLQRLRHRRRPGSGCRCSTGPPRPCAGAHAPAPRCAAAA